MSVLKLTTEKGKSYWGGTGVYQKEYNELFAKLVPDSGEANTVHGELIRTMSRLTYDYYNNGNCNVIDHETETEYEKYTCHECGGCGETESSNENGEEIINETCSECRGEGRIEEEYEVKGKPYITEYFERMIEFLRTHLKESNVVDALEVFLLNETNGYSNYKFSNEEEEEVYIDLADTVMYQILTTENTEREIIK